MALNWEHGRNWAVDYGIAAGTLLCAMLIRWALDPWLGERAPSLILLLAIAVASAWGGWRVGIFLTVIGGVLANVLFVAPRGVFYIAEVTPLLQFVLFIGVGV